MFVPYKELYVKENITKVKNHSIGMGLACSREIARKLGGDVWLKSSKKGLTVFSISIPVIAKTETDHCFMEQR